MQGESLFLPQELWAEAAAEQSDRVTEDPWADVLRDFLDGIGLDGCLGPPDPSTGRTRPRCCPTRSASAPPSRRRPTPQRLKLVMTRTLGWVHKKNLRAGPEGKQGRGYERPSARSRDSEEGKE